MTTVNIMQSPNSMIKRSLLLLGFTVLCLTFTTVAVVQAEEAKSEDAAANATANKAHSTVQTLTADTFHDALNNDPANTLWMLKFYAPWCGHCKKLAPTLDKMAPYLAGKIAIGKIDCTREKEICLEQQVKGYPTLKVVRDGDFFDYNGKRDADSMIEFAELLSKPAVQLVKTFSEFQDQVLSTSRDGVAFVAYHGIAKEVDVDTKQKEKRKPDITTVEKIVASTTQLQLYSTIARKKQDVASFALLDPTVSQKELSLFNFGFEKKKVSNKQFILAKIEKDVPPIIYYGPASNSEKSTDTMMDFVKFSNRPLVTILEGHNFRTVSTLGKPLLIGIIEPDEEAESSSSSSKETKSTTTKFMSSFRDFAQNGPKEYKDRFVFAQMNAKKFTTFTKQFNITSTSIKPQILILDAPKRVYYQNETITEVQQFIEGVDSGLILQQHQDMTQHKNGPFAFLYKFSDWFYKYMPYTGLAVVFWFFITLYYIIVTNYDIEDENENLKMTHEQYLEWKKQRERSLEKMKKNNEKKKSLKED
mmetsp:Transcript_10443/g.11528  ORF Transcript_10443/g.11528 Transcript_10443/m.11528 type:complete len:532 (-) Transcript_10443:37-1632(-)